MTMAIAVYYLLSTSEVRAWKTGDLFNWQSEVM